MISLTDPSYLRKFLLDAEIESVVTYANNIVITMMDIKLQSKKMKMIKEF